MLKKFVTDYLTFSKKDRYAIIILLSIFVIITILPRLLPPPANTVRDDDESLIREMQQLLSAASDSTIHKQRSHNPYISESGNTSGIIPFYFDPNLISTREWVMLGVNKNTAATIKKYIEKGGRFRKPDDLYKIYTLDKKIANQLVPYVRIEKDIHNASRTNSKQDLIHKKNQIPFPGTYPKKQYREIEINSSDTTDFISLPGIGSLRAKSILQYRESLGGFISTEQIREVKLIPDSVFQKIRPYLKVNHIDIKKINLNTTTLKELSKHPYFEYKIADIILRYRQQHGPFEKVSDLMLLHVIDDDFFRKVSPYLTTE